MWNLDNLLTLNNNALDDLDEGWRQRHPEIKFRVLF